MSAELHSVREIVQRALDAPEPSARLREALASIEHDQWVAWSQSLAANETLSAERMARWTAMWVPYADLDEPTKDFDREWADRVLVALAATPQDPEETL